MAYSIVYRSRARVERDESLNAYDASFKAQVNAWLGELATEAAQNRSEISIDLGSLADEALDIEAIDPREWKHSWQRWLKAPLREKLKAVAQVIMSRRPPWQLRGSMRTFSVLSGVFQAEVHVVYEVDHVNKRLVISMFSGLPGQS